MCVVSMIGDHFGKKWEPYHVPPTPLNPSIVFVPPADYEQLKRDVAEMKELLMRAKKYDEANGEPACEKQEKVKLLKAIAELVGVDLSDVFPSQNSPSKT